LYGGNYEEYIEFVRSLFTKAEYPFKFSSWFINMLNNSYEFAFPLLKDELKKQSVRYFEEFFNKNRDIEDRNLWFYYYNTRLKEKYNEIDNSYQLKDKINPIANEILLNRIEKYELTDKFLSSLLRLEPFKNEGWQISFEVINNIFGNIGEFEKYIEKIKVRNSETIKEFVEFYDILKNKAYAPIPFKFIFLKPSGTSA
jgi:hypothetical protein